jgi:hypothetical protein
MNEMMFRDFNVQNFFLRNVGFFFLYWLKYSYFSFLLVCSLIL